MKKILLLASGIFAFLCTSCNSVAPEQPLEPGHEMIFYASCGEPDTRTVRQSDGKVFWSVDEQISIFNGAQSGGGAKFVSLNSEISPTAAFKGNLPSGSGDYWALYPYNASASCNGSSVRTSLSGKQTGVAGSFPDDLYIAVARTSDNKLSFKHPLGGIKFSVANSNIEKVRLIARGGEKLWSDEVNMGFNGSGEAVVQSSGSGSDEIVLTPADGGSFVTGKAYYFVTLPVTLSNGLLMVFERSNGKVYTREVKKSVALSRACFRTLMSADSRASWSTPSLEYSPTSVNLGPNGGTFAVTVSYTGDYHIDIAAGGDWISEVGAEGNPVIQRVHTFKVDPNKGAARTGILTVCDENNCFTLIVNQADGSKTIKHHSVGMRFTADWCQHCPKMNEGFAKAKEQLGDRFNIVNIHTSTSGLAFSDASVLESQFKIKGFPTGKVDGRVDIPNYTNTSYTAQAVIAAVNETEENYWTRSAIGISSSLSGNSLSATVDVTTLESGEYKLTVFLLESGIVHAQTGGSANYVHDYVARKTLTNSATGDSFTSSGSNQFTFSTTIPSGYNKDNLSILAYVQIKYGDQPVIRSDDYGDWYIDNSREAKVGESLAPDFD